MESASVFCSYNITVPIRPNRWIWNIPIVRSVATLTNFGFFLDWSSKQQNSNNHPLLCFFLHWRGAKWEQELLNSQDPDLWPFSNTFRRHHNFLVWRNQTPCRNTAGRNPQTLCEVSKIGPFSVIVPICTIVFSAVCEAQCFIEISNRRRHQTWSEFNKYTFHGKPECFRSLLSTVFSNKQHTLQITGQEYNKWCSPHRSS